GKDILREDYGVTTEIPTPITVIPHGIPSVQFIDPQIAKREVGYGNKLLAVSFGLMSSGKGYEQVIDSLPEVVKLYPNFLYLILGETHPVVRKNEGEKYRRFLTRKIKELGLQNNVKFYNQYLSLQEIIKYLTACDFYVSSGINPNQISSGTLSYALGSGRPAISTPFLHAQDLVTPERGLLVEYDTPNPFTGPILQLLENKSLREQMSQNAYAFTRPMTWSNVALSYLNLIKSNLKDFAEPNSALPKITFSQIKNLTDEFGIIQFANKTYPDPATGYTLDDNSRALIACVMHYQQFKDKSNQSYASTESTESILNLISRYINFIAYVQQEDGRCYNLVNYQREINLDQWSDDAHGRALWALGCVINSQLPNDLRLRAKNIFNLALNAAGKITSPRALAFILAGIYHFNLVYPELEKTTLAKKLADQLLDLFQSNSSLEWVWFEPYLTYANSKLSEGLFYAYLLTKEDIYLKIAEKTLQFLSTLTIEKGIFHPIGQNGWYVRNGQRAYFDQQPIDTSCMVQTLILAYKITADKSYLNDSWKVFRWFIGDNVLRQMIYDESSGGCHDGLGQFSVNLNQGAESTIAYLIARLVMEQIPPPEKSSPGNDSSINKIDQIDKIDKINKAESKNNSKNNGRSNNPETKIVNLELGVDHGNNIQSL
ncbi:MAG TPA: glycosyltransferase, partial [Candidatus Nanoarchaeia archaeon]|nr:glycosyltransferase [Candidatus Nanoarchaeia archaeon]